MKLKNKVTVITGSSSGIGKATALLFAKEGAMVVVNYNSDAKKAEEVVGEIENNGGKGVAIQSDVRNKKQVEEMFKKIVAMHGTVDILINNAGLARRIPFLEITEEDLLQDFKLNLFSQIYCAQEAAKIMQEKGSGKIVNTASVCGMEEYACESVLPYSCAKAGVIVFTKALAKLLSPNIQVNAVAPGYVQTKYWDGTTKDTEKALLDEVLIKRWIKPEEIAQAFLYLISSDAITGEIHVIDGGLTLKYHQSK